MRLSPLAAGLAALALLAAPVLAQNAPAADPAKTVLATVNGEAITEADVALAVDDVAGQFPNLDADGIKRVTLDFLIEVKLAAQAAKAKKVDQSPDFARRLAYVRERVLMQQLLNDESAKATADAAVKAYFDAEIKKIEPAEEVRARHILVEKEEEAKAVHKRVAGGEDFAKVAAELSKDPGSGQSGGDLGFFTKERMVPEFAAAAFALKPGGISEPVKSQFGWHVIKLEERRTRPLPKFEDVKDRLAQSLGEKAQVEYLRKLRAEAKIDNKLPPPAPKAIPAPPAPEPMKN